jgi:hypothetical protein
VNKEYFIKLYPTVYAKAFTYKTICNAWKAIGLLPYNPTAVLKTLLYTGPSASLKIDQLIINTNPQTLRTLKTVKDLQSLQNQIAESTTKRLDGMLKSPV